MYSFWIELNWIVLLNGSGPGIRFQDQYPTITKSQCLLQITGVSASILAFIIVLRGSLDALSCTTKDRSPLWIAWYWLWVKERKLRCEREASSAKPSGLAARLAEGESGCGKPSGLCLRCFALTPYFCMGQPIPWVPVQSLGILYLAESLPFYSGWDSMDGIVFQDYLGIDCPNYLATPSSELDSKVSARLSSK